MIPAEPEAGFDAPIWIAAFVVGVAMVIGSVLGLAGVFWGGRGVVVAILAVVLVVGVVIANFALGFIRRPVLARR